MQPIQSITIPQPCHESWSQMTPVEQGRHCAACSKTVTDFTAMSNQQIINYFAVHSNVCGRVGYNQLNAMNDQLALENKGSFSLKKLAVAAALTSFFSIAKAQDKITMCTPILSQSAKNAKSKQPELTGEVSLNAIKTITGTVTSLDDGSTLPYSIVQAVKSKTFAVVDTSGHFKIDVKHIGDTLKVTSVGFIPQKVLVDSIRSKSCGFALKTDTNVKLITAVLGGIVVKRTPFYLRWWYKFKNMF